jgi:2',3'-cyclic-nucleotide 2'-phosphodiesterase/3'-nucleotidase
MAERAEQMTITILTTSDLHGNIFPIQYATNDRKELGLAKIATLIHKERIDNPHTILIDNGDLIQGTPLAYYHARIDNDGIDPMVKCLNDLHYDAAVIGNHEFNYGLDVLNKAVGESQFPWLSANIVKNSTEQPYFGQPYLIKNFVGGLKVGILGLTTHYIPHWENPRHIKEMTFMDAIKSARYWVDILRRVEQVDLIIVSYHGGFERDLQSGEPTEVFTGENQGYALCHEVSGIDVLLTGHQHRSIAEADFQGAAVVQPGSQGQFLGKVIVTMEKNNKGKWAVVTKKAKLLSVENVLADPEIMKKVKDDEDKTQIWLDQPIGKLIGNMEVVDPMAIRMKDSAFIEFINQVQMEAAQVDISNTALFDNVSRGFKTDITMRDVVSNYIYPNTLKVIRVTGEDIKEALEQTAKYFLRYDPQSKTTGIQVSKEFSFPKPQHYNYDMWEGIEYRINISRPVGERVTKLHYRGQPIEPGKDYDVVMNNYRSGGGGNYTMFQGKPVILDIPLDVSELISNYILERGTIEATVNNNWEVVYDE